jgi:septal ring factor EnvC (AmiA/AmiB activator)
LPVRFRRLLALAIFLGLGALVAGPNPLASGQSGLESQRQSLRSRLAAEDARLASTRDGLVVAQRRLASLVVRARDREARLARAQTRLVDERIRLSSLQRREARAKRTLADNLRAQYQSGHPDLVNIVLASRRFSDLYQQVEFARRLSKNNANILDITRSARADSARQATRLQGLWTRYGQLARAAVADRERADSLRTVLLVRERTQLAHRNGTASRLAVVRTRIARLERARAAAAARAASTRTATTQAPRATGGGGGGGSGAVARVIAAANQIASTPYVWGGGHGGASGGYDCSGSISYALAAGGLLSGALDSTGFMSWGEPGPGSRITVYANAGHAFMIVDGRRFDTSALSGGGTRWTSAGRSTAGFVARHPPGL